jgi:hypothetical protein
MKKYFLMFGLTLVMGLFISNTVVAQWTPGTGILWTNDRVGIGTDNPDAKLTIYRTAAAQPATASQYAIMNNAQGAGLNFYKARVTAATPTSVNTHDAMGGLIGFQHNGTSYIGTAAMRFFADSPNTGRIVFQTNGGSGFANRMVIKSDGNVGIGTLLPTALLSVNGKILAKEVEVTEVAAAWPDFVFNSDYNLMTLSQVEEFIMQNRHLPNVPSEADVQENGVRIGEMTGVLLQKIEELTLYIIDLNKRIAELENK